MKKSENNINKLFTNREQEVLVLLVSGKSNTEIANELLISTHTVKAHVGAIFTKLKVRDRVQAAVAAVIHGIVSVDIKNFENIDINDPTTWNVFWEKR